MTERERWTVYPLLLLSLGISLRSQMTGSLDLKEISCRTLKSQEVRIINPEDDVRLVLNAVPESAGGGGSLTFFSDKDKPEMVLQAAPHGGIIEIAAPSGAIQVVLSVSPQGGGGYVQTRDAQGKLIRVLATGANPLQLIPSALPPNKAKRGDGTQAPDAKSDKEEDKKETETPMPEAKAGEPNGEPAESETE